MKKQLCSFALSALLAQAAPLAGAQAQGKPFEALQRQIDELRARLDNLPGAASPVSGRHFSVAFPDAGATLDQPIVELPGKWRLRLRLTNFGGGGPYELVFENLSAGTADAWGRGSHGPRDGSLQTVSTNRRITGPGEAPLAGHSFGPLAQTSFIHGQVVSDGGVPVSFLIAISVAVTEPITVSAQIVTSPVP